MNMLMASRAWKHIFRFEPISNLVLNDDRMEPMIGRPATRRSRALPLPVLP
jgi:hypothetical protein